MMGTGVTREQVLDRLPYLGLDIEGLDQDSVRIEYNPNRPDFSTDVGIARALRGLLGKQTGLPRYRAVLGRIVVHADRNPPRIRPFVACAVARELNLDDESIRQIISMQEDLHNGLGRKRAKVAIGLHNLDVLSPPIHYEGMRPDFSFTPLGETQEMRMSEILERTKTGQAYSHILAGADRYPLLRDSKDAVLSFPPIINGVLTKIDTTTRNIFVDITSTEQKAGQDALAIIMATLADMGATIESVRIKHPTRIETTPDMSPTRMRLSKDVVRRLTGLQLTTSGMKTCLGKSRLGLAAGNVMIPKYRIDILHPADIAEEVAIGYGLDRIDSCYPPSSEAGNLDARLNAENKIGDLMAQSGFIEATNYELQDEVLLYQSFARPAASAVQVQDSRSLEHSVLRDSLIPSLMSILKRDTKEEYPQRIFELGRVYQKPGPRVEERQYLAALSAHSSASFSEAKMYLAAVVKSYDGSGISTAAANHWAFTAGRCAQISRGGRILGHVGEIKPFAIASFGLEVPVCGFEIDVSELTQSVTR